MIEEIIGEEMINVVMIEEIIKKGQDHDQETETETEIIGEEMINVMMIKEEIIGEEMIDGVEMTEEGQDQETETEIDDDKKFYYIIILLTLKPLIPRSRMIITSLCCLNIL